MRTDPPACAPRDTPRDRSRRACRAGLRLPGAAAPRRLRRLATSIVILALVLAAAPGGSIAEVSRSQQLKAETFEKMNRGIKALHDGRAKEAVELLTEVTRMALNSFRGFYYLGLAYKADRQYLKAIEPLIFALDLDPTHMQAHVDLGDCYLKRGDTGEALAEYHRALEIQQGFAPAWDGLGRAAEAAGDDETAIAHFKKAIEVNPGFPGAPLNLGDLYLRAGKLREAVDLFLEAISVRPDFAAAYNRLGVAYARQRLGNEAIAALRRASELERGNPWHPYTIGLIELDLGYLGRALRSFEAAIRLDASYLEAYVEKARILRRMGLFEDAELLLEAAADQPSEDVKLLGEIEALRADFHRQRLAIEDIQARVESGLAEPAEIRTLAGLRAETGDYAGAARALAGLQARAAEQAGDAEAAFGAADLFTLGYYHLRAGSYAEAADVFAEVRSGQPGSAAVLLNLGLSLEGRGMAHAASLVYEEALGLAPGDVTILVALGNVLVLEGRYDEAARAFERALASPAEFGSRSRVETILKALRSMPEAPRASGTAREPGGGGR